MDNTVARPAPRRWSFGAAVVDERTLELRVEGQLVGIERKPLEVLLYLLSRPDEVVTKDQLLDAVWPGRVLSETALTRCIFKLREALGDEKQEVVKTLHGVGYRFVAPIRVEPSITGTAEAPGAAERSPGHSRRNWMLAGGAAATVVVAALLWFLYPGPPRAGDKSVAVLPFANLGANPDEQYFAEGLHDGVITHLARVQDLRVISRASVMGYGKGDRNLRVIAGELGVAHIVEGSVQRVGERLRVRAQLIDSATDTHLWAAEYDRGLSDVFAVQADIALKITGAVQARLLDREKARIERIPTQNLAAYELYLRGSELDRQTYGPDQTLRYEAIAKLAQAIALDPQFALAHALLARQHYYLHRLGLDRSEQRLAMVRDAAEAALQLDPDLAEARMARALYLSAGPRDEAAALKELEAARQMAPGNPLILEMLAGGYHRQARWDEGVAALEAAVQVDPRNESLLQRYAERLMLFNRYAEADQMLARALSVSTRPLGIRVFRALNRVYWKGDLAPLGEVLREIPQDACVQVELKMNYNLGRRRFREAAAGLLACKHVESFASIGESKMPKEIWIADAYRLAGDSSLANEYYRKARPKIEASLRSDADQPYKRLRYAFLLAALGDRTSAFAEADRALESRPLAKDPLWRAEWLYEAARLHAFVGDHERALEELELALTLPAGKAAHYARFDPFLDPLREDPRFQKLIAEHLPKE